MKISLRWVFDHIVGGLKEIDIEDLVARFIKTTAEIDHWKKVSFDATRLTVARVVSAYHDAVHLYSSEYDKNYTAPIRQDVLVGAMYLITIETGTQVTWTTSSEVGGTKDIALPSVCVDQSLNSGSWKQAYDNEDYIIDIDNKSINHRPDLWSHRGIAREMAAILGRSLIPLEELTTDNGVNQKMVTAINKTGSYTLSVADGSGCDQFAALYLSDIVVTPSALSMAIRLSRLDSRVINFLVDATNYVMFDIGQPMHAFDAAKITDGLLVRKAYDQEKLLLLDGDNVTCSFDDIIVADSHSALSLAGIMGGSATSITSHTQNVLLEAAHFDASTIRKSSMRHKKRTESSVRFEKNSDPYQVCDAIRRFLFLLKMHGIACSISSDIALLGTFEAAPLCIMITHSFIENRLGMTLTSDTVVTILQQLSFFVTRDDRDDDIVYEVTVPSWRASKDVSIAEDLVEEVGRFIGYDSIAQVLPSVESKPSDVQCLYRLREVKHMLSYGFSMRELYGYAFFNESFLKVLAWEPSQYVEVKNPVSENYARLVTTLQPHMLHAVNDSAADYSVLRFYECGRAWHMNNGTIQERAVLTGIIYDREQKFDFYDGKALLTRLFDMLAIKSITWKHCTENSESAPWFVVSQTATIVHRGIEIGVMGVVDSPVLQSHGASSTVMFELDIDYVVRCISENAIFTPLPRYPSVRRDVSMLIPVDKTIDMVTQCIKSVDQRIESVTLIDFFEKREWKGQRSVTFHVEMRDVHKTLDHVDAENMLNRVIEALVQQGAIIR